MTTTLPNALREHLALCEQLLEVAQRENRALRDPDPSSRFEACQTRRNLLPRLEASLAGLRRHREAWQRQPLGTRSQQPEVGALLRRNQDLIMRILVLDRENEQCLLRRGLVPARHIPPAGRQRPHFVADLYRRNGLGSGNAD